MGLKLTGLHVTTARTSGVDCTNGGVTSKYEHFILLCEEGNDPDVSGPFSPSPDTPALVLKGRGDYLYAVPKEIVDRKEHSMFGGNWVYTSDSRFPCHYPIPVHDRQETEEESRLLSQ